LEDKALTTRVILVRHGESTYNVLRKVQGHFDESYLTQVGEAAARQVGVALQGLEFSAAYSSPLQRAKQTAALILSTLEQSEPQRSLPSLQLRDDLKEINLFLWEGLDFDEVERRFPEGYRLWRDRPHELSMQIPSEAGDGVTEFFPVPALYEQAKEFWREVLPNHAGETILVVAHSGINRALIGSAIGLEPESYQSFYQSNCGISVLNFAGGLGQPVQLESVNLTGHLGEVLPKMRTGQQGPRLLLVRHGETDWNRQKRFQGQIDVPLNDQGRVQAEQAGAFLASVPLTGAVSSPMLRPKQTAEVILQQHPGLTLELNEDLREIGHGLWEGKLEAEIEQGYPGLLAQWQSAPETVQMPEGENLRQVWERAIAAWNTIVANAAQANPTGITLVVAHDAVNKAILCYLAEAGPERFWAFKQGNGAVSVIDYPHGVQARPVIQAMNITTHLGGVLDRTAAGAL
jgi:broad specificity phosphatase PhoE